MKKSKPWPTKDAMAQIYELNLWGGGDTDFYSGSGSHQDELVRPYVEVVTSFLKTFDEKPVVCDLGCGDFNVGKEFYPFTNHYFAIDIVPALINRNQEKFKADNLSFVCLDIAKDELPKANCIILRQVLQHLSNFEVQQVVNKLSNYQYLILTEHIPAGEFSPNQDIISGQGIRLKKQSGVDLLAEPFNLQVRSKQVLLSVEVNNGEELVVTSLFKF